MSEYQWIGGAVAVEAVLRADSREVAAVYVERQRYDTAAARIQQLARARNVPVERATAETLAGLVAGEAHDNIVARVGPRRLLASAALFDVAGAVNVMLDGVEDPYNFGQAVRSLYAAGIDGVVVRSRNWLSAAATVIRASAGATEWLPTAAAETDEAIAAARARSIPIAVAAADGRPMDDLDLTGPLFLIIGGEKRGVARAVQQAADWRVAIPYGRDFAHSLGTAGAAAVLAFEIMRQRRARR